MVSGARKRIAESDSEVSAEACVGGEDKRHKKMETAGDGAVAGSEAAQTAEPQPPHKKKKRKSRNKSTGDKRREGSVQEEEIQKLL